MLKLCPAMVAVYDFRLAKKMHKLSEGHISNISNKQFQQHNLIIALAKYVITN